MAVTKEDVVSFIDNMTVLEMSEFVKELEDKYGVTAAAPMMAMPMGGGDAGGAAAAEEKTEFDVVLTAAGDKNFSDPADRFHGLQGDVAQLGERLVCNQEVGGSSPLISTRFRFEPIVL